MSGTGNKGGAVKALVWDDATSTLIGPHVYYSRATTPFGSFRTEQIIDGVWSIITPSGECIRNAEGRAVHFGTLDEAKAAAQGDYERRILSALAEPTKATAAPEMYEALKADTAVLENLLAYLRKHADSLPPASLSSLEVRIEKNRAALRLAEGQEPRS